MLVFRCSFRKERKLENLACTVSKPTVTNDQLIGAQTTINDAPDSLDLIVETLIIEACSTTDRPSEKVGKEQLANCAPLPAPPFFATDPPAFPLRDRSRSRTASNAGELFISGLVRWDLHKYLNICAGSQNPFWPVRNAIPVFVFVGTESAHPGPRRRLSGAGAHREGNRAPQAGSGQRGGLSPAAWLRATPAALTSCQVAP